LVLTSLKATLNIFYRWSPVYVPEIETGRHVKNNAYAVEIKIKGIIRKHMTYENTYRDDRYGQSKYELQQNALISYPNERG
jgi:hypothetical protein